jgi:hypothetical protein
MIGRRPGVPGAPAVELGITLIIGAFELGVIPLDDLIEGRLPGLARAINGRDWG